MSSAHNTYRGIDSNSMPRNSVTRLVAPASTNMPVTLTSSRPEKSPNGARSAARSRIENTIAVAAEAKKIRSSESAKSSIRSARSTT